MMNEILYNRAVKLVSDCAIPPHLSGFTFLSEAAVIRSENSIAKLSYIYSTIASNHNNTQRAITRSIKYAISQSDSIGNILSINKNYLFNGRVIAALALRLKSIQESGDSQH